MSNVSLNAVKSLIHFLSKQGISRNKLFSVAGLQESHCQVSRALIDTAHYEALYLFAENEYLLGNLKLRNIGFEFGKQISSDRWGLITHIVFCSPNLESALSDHLRYQTLAGDIGFPIIQKPGNEITFDWIPTYRCCRHTVEEIVTSWVALAKALSVNPVKLNKVSFIHKLPPGSADAYEQYFACPVEFGSTANRISADRDILKSKFAYYEPEIYGLLKNHADKALANLIREFPIDAIKRFISSNLVSKECSVESCAKNLNVSARTLQRHLAKHNLNFSMLTDSLRRDRSVELVKDPDLDLTYIAHALGFSEQSSFSRAFRRWTAQTPSEYRVAMHAGSEPNEDDSYG